MGFIKVVKNKAYFKRFQVKFRRRRENKTDYYARKRLIIQDKNKYKTPKYRLVVRFSNRDITTQIVAADLTHDIVVASAYAHELPRYGIKHGLTNYAAAYATGLLLARRVNQKFKLSYEGNSDINGEDFNVEPSEDGPAPFKALLDVGLRRTTTGARMFGTLKGATDGGLNVPHNERRFPGSKKDDAGAWSYDPELHKKYIFGGHVAAYMESLQDDEDAMNTQFGKYVASGVTAKDIEGIYKSAHAAIRAEPYKPRDAKEKGSFLTREKAKDAQHQPAKKHHQPQKTSIGQKKGRVKQRLTGMGKKNVTLIKA